MAVCCLQKSNEGLFKSLLPLYKNAPNYFEASLTKHENYKGLFRVI
jgi:hypothetical protein